MSAALTIQPDRQPDHQNAVPSNALIPENMDQAMRLATAMANAKLVPQHLQGDVGSCLMIVEQAMRWRASPFAVAQCTSSIGGSLCYEGKLIAAILPACGAIIGELNYEYEGDPKKPETLSVTVTGRRASDGEIKTLKLAWIDAKTKNQYWTSQPEQQLCYAGARVWARRWTPGPMLGIYAPEEFDRSTGRVKEDFAGPTIDGEAEAEKPHAAAASVQRAPRVTGTKTETKTPPAVTAQSLNDGERKWLAGWQAEFDKAKTTATVMAVEKSNNYQVAVSDENPAYLVDRLRSVTAAAYQRVMPPPVTAPIENAPEHAASDAASDTTTTTPETLEDVRIEGEAKMAAGD